MLYISKKITHKSNPEESLASYCRCWRATGCQPLRRSWQHHFGLFHQQWWFSQELKSPKKCQHTKNNTTIDLVIWTAICAIKFGLNNRLIWFSFLANPRLVLLKSYFPWGHTARLTFYKRNSVVLREICLRKHYWEHRAGKSSAPSRISSVLKDVLQLLIHLKTADININIS